MKQDPAKTVVRNCIVMARDREDILFSLNADGTCTVRLDGYVICPRERLQEVAARALLGDFNSTAKA